MCVCVYLFSHIIMLTHLCNIWELRKILVMTGLFSKHVLEKLKSWLNICKYLVRRVAKMSCKSFGIFDACASKFVQFPRYIIS